jgi:multidrug resistance efflux pump
VEPQDRNSQDNNGVSEQRSHRNKGRIAFLARERGKVVRIVIGFSILALAIWTFYPGLFLPIGTRAVVNARVLTVRAPISGVVTELNAKEGVTVNAGQTLGKIVNQRTDPSRLEQLRTEAAAFQERTTVLQNKLRVLEQLRTRLDGELGQYRDVVVSHYERRIAESKAIRAARLALADESRSNLRRQKSLQTKKLTSEEKVETAKRRAEVSRAELAEIDHVIERLTSELEAARKGIYLADGFNNVPYSQQRMDEITVTLASTQSDLDEALIRYRELQREIEIEDKRHQLMRSASLVSPHTGPVWRNLVNVGEYVEQGTPLLELVDPSELFMLVQLDVRHFDTIAQGDRATIELLGSESEIEGRVVNSRGGQAIRDKDALAVGVPAPDPREFRVMVAVDAKDLDSKASDFLQIGRISRVHIHSERNDLGLRWPFGQALASDSNSGQTGAKEVGAIQ